MVLPSPDIHGPTGLCVHCTELWGLVLSMKAPGPGVEDLEQLNPQATLEPHSSAGASAEGEAGGSVAGTHKDL